MRAILAGGGTGGHVIPALAIAQELRQRFGAEVLFVGTSRGIETRLVPAAGFALRLITVGALKNVGLATRLHTALQLPRAMVDSWRILSDFMPAVVIGVGGYASGPVMLAAALSGRPTVVFEPNVVPGFANRVVGVMVSAAAVQFQESCRYFANCRVTGIPVRREFFQLAGRRPPGERPTLLVFGGSQGAHVLNQTMVESLTSLTAQIPGLHIIHQLGERDYNDAQAAYLRAGVSADLFPFIEDMAAAFERADLLVCRSGASTVAEVMAAGKPAILVPFPHAADDHQTRNAQALARAGAAVLLPEGELSCPRLVEMVTALMSDRPGLARMGAAARALAHPHAAQEVAELAARVAAVAG